MAYPVRVFNRDFVEENVFFESKSTKPITYVSKEDIASARELKELRQTESSLTQESSVVQRDWEKKSDEKENFGRRTAKQIKEALGINAGDRYRNYNIATLKESIESTGIENFKELSSEEYDQKMNLIRSEPLKILECLPEYDFDLQFKGRTLRGFPEISEEISILLGHSVISETIKRLEEDDGVNRWVEKGFRLHRDKNEKKKCLFCQNELEAGFLESLSKHFSNDYKNLQRDIESFIRSLSSLKKENISEEDQNITVEIRDEYRNKENKLNAVQEEINNWIDQITNKLEEKRKNPFLSMNSVQLSKDFGCIYNEAIQNLNSVVERHRHECQNHVARVNAAKEGLESHMIACAVREDRYAEIISSLNLLTEKKDQVEHDLEKIRMKISDLEKKTSDIGGAATEINQYLEEFFGRKEISLELDSSERGYVVRRNKERASNLSEGEKNAIAFSYFIVKARERGFNIQEGIIVIDDPVSSFDSNFTYHCFSLIKNNFKEARQLILLTHNFEIFSLVKNQWFSWKNKKVEKKGKLQSLPCEFFMIRNEIRDERRCAMIAPLDKTLVRFDSEYHFLFSELDQFLEDTEGDYADCYRIGNMARRFLETYVNFKIPTTSNLRDKLEQLFQDCNANESTRITKTHRDRLYRLINESSHTRDFAGALRHGDRSEIVGRN